MSDGPTDPALRARLMATLDEVSFPLPDGSRGVEMRDAAAVVDAALAAAEAATPVPGDADFDATAPNYRRAAAEAARETPNQERHIYFCQTCGKTRFVEWLHRNCPPDVRSETAGETAE